jgi:hypothetical protein
MGNKVIILKFKNNNIYVPIRFSPSGWGNLFIYGSQEYNLKLKRSNENKKGL